MAGVFDRERALVVGYAVSGRSAALTLLAEGASVRVSEERPLEELEVGPSVEGVPDLRDLDVDLRPGGHRPEHLDGVTMVVVSPGVAERTPLIAWAGERGIPVWNEVEVGARVCRVPYVAVTGTNGKTTTSEMIAAVMRAAGLRARACGNVGYPFTLAAREPHEALAVEVSSFQLRFQESLHPRVSVLLNLAPDHLDWHGSFAAYVDAKTRIYARQGPDDTHVGNLDDPEAAARSAEAPCRVRWFRHGPPTEDGGSGVVEGHVVASIGGELMDLGAPLGAGRPFLADAAAAAAASVAFGLPADAVRSAVEAFEPLPHRGGVVAQIGSVRFVDDSKATNLHAALAALEGRSDVVLIAGGQAKGVDLSPLRDAVDRLAGVVAIGESGPEVVELFSGLVPVRSATSMADAVGAAWDLVPAGGTVLLAPACASYDMFRDYAERGDRFATAARALAGEIVPQSHEPRRSNGQ